MLSFAGCRSPKENRLAARLLVRIHIPGHRKKRLFEQAAFIASSQETLKGHC